MARPKSPVDPAEAMLEVASQKGGKTVDFNEETGILKNPVVFAPKEFKQTSRGRVFFTKSGRAYAESIFPAIVEGLSNVLAYPFHPEWDAVKQDFKARNVKDAIGRWGALMETTGADGLPEVRGQTFRFYKNKLNDFKDVIADGMDRIAFSICALENIGEFWPEVGCRVITGLPKSPAWLPTIDLLEGGGAAKSILESVAINKSEEKDTMTTEEIQAAMKTAATEAVNLAIAPLKTELDNAKAEAVKARHKAAVLEKISASKLDAKHTPPEFVAMLEGVALEQAEKYIAERVKFVSENTNPVQGMGGAADDKREQPVLEAVAARGLQPVLEGICSVSEQGEARRPAIMAKLAQTEFGAAAKASDKSEPTRKLRRQIIAAMEAGSISLRGLAASFMGVPRHELTPRLVDAMLETTGTPVLSSGFTNINSALLASILIEAYDIEVAALGISDLYTIYDSTRFPETYAGYTAAGGIATTAENAAANDATIAETYVTDPATRPAKKTVMFWLTREEVLLDQPKQVVMRGNKIAEDAACEEHVDILHGMFELNSVDSYRPSGVAADLFSTGNTQFSNPMTDWNNILTAGVLRRGQNNNNNRFITVTRPYVLFVADDIKDRAEEIVNTTEWKRSQGANQETQETFISSIRGTMIRSSPYYNSAVSGAEAGDWFLGGGFRDWQRTYLLKRFIPFEVVQVPQAEVQAVVYDRVAGVKVEFDQWIVALTNKRIIRNEATSSP